MHSPPYKRPHLHCLPVILYLSTKLTRWWSVSVSQATDDEDLTSKDRIQGRKFVRVLDKQCA